MVGQRDSPWVPNALGLRAIISVTLATGPPLRFPFARISFRAAVPDLGPRHHLPCGHFVGRVPGSTGP